MLYNFNAAAAAPAVLGNCPSVRVSEDIAALSELQFMYMMLVLVPILLVCAGLRISTKCRPWYITYVS